MRILALHFFALAMILAPAATASATNIFIPNGDFESLIKPSDGATGTFVPPLPPNDTSWTLGMGNNVHLFTFQFPDPAVNWSDNTVGESGDLANTPGWSSDNTSSAGEQPAIGVGGSNGAFIDGVGFGHIGGLITSTSSIGTIAAHASYTLSIQVSDANGGDASLPLDLDLLAGDSPIPSSSSVVPTVSATFQTYSKTYDAAALSAFVGDPIVIQFGAGSAGHQTDFDNVTLTETAVPEPSSIVEAIGVASLGLIGLVLRRRRSVV